MDAEDGDLSRPRATVSDVRPRIDLNTLSPNLFSLFFSRARQELPLPPGALNLEMKQSHRGEEHQMLEDHQR